MGIFSFQKTDRLLNRSDFLLLSKKGQRIHNREFIAVYSYNMKGKIRLGITITKKVGTASTRNRIKRLIREYFRVNKNWIQKGYDINIIAKKEAAHLNFDEAVVSLDNIFNRVSRRLCH
ncbi:Ribonuclease P protein component [Candidatus Magnetomoraceae bacterium gMMP-15]